jgi:hypothetical protein
MTWTDIEHRWTDLIDHIRERWPETAAEHLHAIAGDRARFTDYLAEVHELTWAEAADAIEVWLFQRARVGLY